MAICDRSCVKPLLSGFLILLTDSRFLLLFSRLLIPSHIFLILNKLVSKYLWKCSFLLKRVNVRIWYRGYYTVTQRYEFYFRVGKQYFTNECSLCLNEKFIIICKKELCRLNRRNKLASSCPHRKRYVRGNFRVTWLKTRLYYIFYNDR